MNQHFNALWTGVLSTQDVTSNLDIQILETDILVNKKTLVGNTFKQLNN